MSFKAPNDCTFTRSFIFQILSDFVLLVCFVVIVMEVSIPGLEKHFINAEERMHE